MFSDAESLHKYLLEFATLSEKRIKYNNKTYSVHHTQYSSYNIEEVLIELIENTNSDPRYDREFSEEAIEAVQNTSASVSRNMNYLFTNREILKEDNLRQSCTCYHDTINYEHLNSSVINPKAETRNKAIAEVLSLVNAWKAHYSASLKLKTKSDTDKDKPNKDVNSDYVNFALRDTAHQLHGPSSLSQINPDLEVVRSMYEIYEEIGMEQRVRDFYGFLASPQTADFFKPNDAIDNKLSKSFSGFMMGGLENSKKWTSNQEPPLETLDSYDK